MSRRWLMLAIIVLVGCSPTSRVQIDDEPPPSIDTSFERLPMVLAGVQKSGDVLLYEGLPDIFWEPNAREQELKLKKTIKFHGYPFYDDLLTVQGTDAEQLTALFSATSSFGRYRVSKEGGGYNPDYCVEWKTEGGATQALISLECGEVKIYAPQSELHCDLSPEAGQKLKQLLGQYRKNRPARE